MESIDWKAASVEYRLETHSTVRFLTLVGICFLSMAPALLLALAVGYFMPSLDSGVFAAIGVLFVLGTPFAVYFIFRKWLRLPITIRLEPGKVIIKNSKETTTLTVDRIKSYEAAYELAEDDTESVFIRDMNGKTIRITSSLLSGSLREMGSFRHDFEGWAATHKLTRWSPWFRRSWSERSRA